LRAVIRGNCQQIAYIEAILMGTGTARAIIPGDGITLWEIQKKFRPVTHSMEYELVTGKFFQLSGGVFPFRVKFEYNDFTQQATMQMSRKCLNALQSLMPSVFTETIEWDEQEEIKEIEITRPPEDLLPKTKPTEKKYN